MLANGALKPNTAQLGLIKNLQSQIDNLRSSSVPRWLPTRWTKPAKQGAYIFGEVGTGKTMIMDMVYEGCGLEAGKKLRVHFNQFMLNMHERVHEMRRGGMEGDQIVPKIARELGSQHRLLCLDEFQVVDIADAMLLRVLIESLLSTNIHIMVTSNRSPSDLYQNGIQRHSFLPCMELLERRLGVYNLNSGIDFRLQEIGSTPYYFYPGDTRTLQEMNDMYHRLKLDEMESSSEISVMGRSIKIRKAAGKKVWFEFPELFQTPLSSVDYIALANTFDTFFLSNVPIFRSMDMRMEARRFMTFIDILYDSRKNLVIQAEGPITSLFPLENTASGSISQQEILDELQHSLDASILTGAEENFAAARTISRLHQMTSQSWNQ